MSRPYVSAPDDLSEQQFSEWRQLLEERVGIRLTAQQKQLLCSQVSIRMREVGEDDFTGYFNRVSERVDGQLEWSILLDRLLVKETSFFRHRGSLDYICGHLQDRINNGALRESYDVWSLGCSSGEEPYSLAMMINECFELAKLPPAYSILGTDISRVAVAIARAACYSKRKLEQVPSAFRYKYFKATNKGQYRFEHSLVSKMCFSCVNILQLKSMPKLSFDVIYCQNVLLYFPQTRRHSILDVIAEKLRPGGLLAIGLGEVTNWSHASVKRVARADVQIYQRHLDGTNDDN